MGLITGDRAVCRTFTEGTSLSDGLKERFHVRERSTDERATRSGIIVVAGNNHVTPELTQRFPSIFPRNRKRIGSLSLLFFECKKFLLFCLVVEARRDLERSRSWAPGCLDDTGNVEGQGRNTRHGARTTVKLTGPSTVVAAYDQINERASGMQILNELMKIKNAPAKGVRLISKTSCGPRSPLYPGPGHDHGDSWQKRPLSVVSF